MKTKELKSERLRNGLGGRGMRMQLLTTAERDPGQELKNDIGKLVNDFHCHYSTADVITARIIAAGLKADGSFAPTSDEPWFNLGASALALVRGQGPSAKQAMTKRLVNCVSLPLEQAGPHIFSLAKLLISKGQAINFERLFWDLRNWDDPDKQIKVLWASGFNPLPRDNNS